MGPLHGLKVFEIEAIGPVPWAGMMLSDIGADVLRIDRPAPPDLGVERDMRFELSARGRRSLVANLKTPQDVETVLEKHELGARIFKEVGRVLLARGLRMSRGTIVDATIFAADSSTKNAEAARDPEMHQTKKGNEWHFGMKAHVGVDSQSKVIHSVVVTPASTADCKVMDRLLHGEETRAYDDQAYKSQGQVIRAKAPRARDFTNRQCKWKHHIDAAIKSKNRTKSRIRSRVEHSIGVIKRVFGFAKVRYRGLAKNGNRVFVTAALANIFLVRYTVLGAVRPRRGNEAEPARFRARNVQDPTRTATIDCSQGNSGGSQPARTTRSQCLPVARR